MAENKKASEQKEETQEVKTQEVTTPKAKTEKTQEELAQEQAEAKAAQEQKDLEEKQKAYDKSAKIEVDKKTKDNYAPKPGEEKTYHVKIEKRNFNAATGKKESIARVQQFDPKGFKAFKDNAAGLGYTVEVLHDPTGEYPTFGVGVEGKISKK